ncbi:TrpB-like pyridoxal phosphate-dependent enzyme [Myxococcota bacterium]|nr:TrpB-like pyridoxal phosphate-dependent enzyme [Myxococcota bacterium]MBU1537063.1 TrpB-like pyridoxal phosphate-dependent enzyme [Myxococcota bacterium]
METKIILSEQDMPTQWYNIAADMPGELFPPLGPAGSPLEPAQLESVFPHGIIEQEVSRERWIPIPEEVRSVLFRWRPTPLRRAHALERHLGYGGMIFYKDESVSPAGSHKPNSAVPQAYYNMLEGVKRLTTETGAGQWGSALSFACAQFGLGCRVFMVGVSYDQKPARKTMMELWGGTCVRSPSQETAAGRRAIRDFPGTPGSLGIAISEAVEAAVTSRDVKTRYALGSVLNHVLLHQTIIGLEAKKQCDLAGVTPDVVIGCVGGGSNFAGLAFPFAADKIAGVPMEIIPVEPKACPTMTRGTYTYDYGDTAGLTPLLAMHTLGHRFIPPPIHAGGLRYHGVSPLISHGIDTGLFTPRAHDQVSAYEAAMLWARSEGTLPAPETSHAIAAVVDRVRQAQKEGKCPTILFNYSGHGLMDLAGYEKYLRGDLTPYAPSDHDLSRYMAGMENLPPLARNLP